MTLREREPDRSAMHRGVYFDAWFPRQHCYHPSLPPRRLRMVDDLVDYRATMLVWAALGGGSLALPYLEQEAFGPVEPRARFYGFVNDAEFIAACHAQGHQGHGHRLRGPGLGVPGRAERRRDRDPGPERAARRGPARLARAARVLGQPLPEAVAGLRDLLPGRPDQQPRRAGHRPDRPSAWPATSTRTPATPAGWSARTASTSASTWTATTRSGGSTSRRSSGSRSTPGSTASSSTRPSCRSGRCSTAPASARTAWPGSAATWPAWTRGRPSSPDVDLASFHYGDWLRAQGYDFRTDQAGTPLFGAYYAYQCAAITTHFAELAAYAREYGRSVGREVLVSGNFFNLDPHYLPLAAEVDLIITEMRNTTYRQPEWYRYVDAFRRYAGGRRRDRGREPVRRGGARAGGRPGRRPRARPVAAQPVRGRGLRGQHERPVRVVDGRAPSRTRSGRRTTC